MKQRWSCVALAGALLIAGVAMAAKSQESGPKKEKGPAMVILENWNDIGGRLLAMAQDWPEDKYSYKPNPQVRSFAQVILHVAGSNYSLVNQVAGKKLGNGENDPSVEEFKTKVQAVEFLKKSVADGAAAIQEQGDAGISKHLGAWVGYTEHMGEHYGQLVVYYRNNGMVPPESRPKK